MIAAASSAESTPPGKRGINPDKIWSGFGADSAKHNHKTA
jgi:hypothetical protein